MTIQNLADAKKAIEIRIKVLTFERDKAESQIAKQAFQYRIDELTEYALPEIEQAQTEMLSKIDEEVSMIKSDGEWQITRKGEVNEFASGLLAGFERSYKIITGETKDNKLPVADPQ